MYSPKELEEEVDHSFFDSDCEENGAGDVPLRSKQETHVSMNQKVTEDINGRNGKRKAKSVDGLQEIQAGDSEEKQCKSEHMKSVPIPNAKNSDIRKNSQSDEGSSVHSYSSDEENEPENRKLSKSSNGDINSDDDGYHRSDDESEDEDKLQQTQSSKSRGHGTPKKCSGKLRNLSRSSSSSSDSDLSHSSEERSPVYSQKSFETHHRVGSAHQRDIDKESGESEDTVTDVTPLSTPDVSPAQSIDVVLPSEPNVVQEVSDEQASISSEAEDEPALLKIETQSDRGLVSSAGSVGSRRKNYSFSNEEVRRIDQENQRLLRELSRSSARSRSGRSTISSSSSRKSSAPPVRLYHSAINRQKEQERIQKENLAFLKRLESVKATPGLTRDEQLTDYQRQCRYLGTHAIDIPPLKEKSTSGRSSRPCSSPHKARPETAKHRATPRPAWS